jgi:hypothetical protein
VPRQADNEQPDDTQAVGQVHELQPPTTEVVAEPIEGDDAGDDWAPLGEPFALTTGADLLQQAQGVPGCWASVRCDCGRAFKVDLLSQGIKPCPGCRTPFSHVLIFAPADDCEIVNTFLEHIDDSEPGDDSAG